MPQHKSMEELQAGLPQILASPQDNGEIKAIVRREAHYTRIKPGRLDAESNEGDRHAIRITPKHGTTPRIVVEIDDGVAKLATSSASDRSPGSVVVDRHDLSGELR